jgi:hypothetical protein
MGRFLEPSTWAGISAMLATIVGFIPGTAGLVVGGIGAATGGVAVYLRERK